MIELEKLLLEKDVTEVLVHVETPGGIVVRYVFERTTEGYKWTTIYVI